MFYAMNCWVNCSLILDNNNIGEFEETQAKGDVSQNWWPLGVGQISWLHLFLVFGSKWMLHLLMCLILHLCTHMKLMTRL